MRLPEDLTGAMEREFEKVSHPALVQAVSQLTTRYQGEDFSGPIIVSDALRAAYLAVRVPATYAAASRVLEELKRYVPEEEVGSVLDLGSGPGTVLHAAAWSLPALRQMTAIESDTSLIELGRRLASQSFHECVQKAAWLCRDLKSGVTKNQHDLVVMSYVLGELPAAMAEKAIAGAWNTFSMPSTAVSILSIAVMIFCLKYAKQIPGAILVTFGATAAVVLFHMNVETIGTRFGGIPKGLPTIVIPQFHYDIFRQLLSSAFTVAMLGAIESLMSAVVSDRMSNDKHNPNMELIGQGVANILSPLFGGLPATGAIARTATNVRSGAKTPVAGMIHALTLLGIILFAAPLVKSVPLAALASILMIVAYNMGDWEEIPEILKLSAADITVWLLTMTLTVVADLTFAVEVGMVLAALMFIRKVSRTTTVSPVTKDYVEDSRVHVLQGKDIPDYVIVYRIHGPFLFGATDKFADILHHLDKLPPIIILRLRNMTAIDATGLGAIRDLADTVHESGRSLLLCGAREQPSQLMKQAEFERHVSAENICGSITEALERAAEIHRSQYAGKTAEEFLPSRC